MCMPNKGFFNLLCHHDYGEVVGVWNFGRRDFIEYYILYNKYYILLFCKTTHLSAL